MPVMTECSLCKESCSKQETTTLGIANGNRIESFFICESCKWHLWTGGKFKRLKGEKKV